MNANSIDTRIKTYLPSLTLKQKKAVLTVVKTFAKRQNKYNNDFKRELDSRYEDIVGYRGLVSERRVQKRIRNIIRLRKTVKRSKYTNGYSDEFKRELDSRYEDYINGGEVLTWEEVNKGIQEIIKGK